MDAAPWSVPVRIVAWPERAVALEAVVATTPVGEVVVLVTVDAVDGRRAIGGLAMVRTDRAEALAALVDDLASAHGVRARLDDDVHAGLGAAAVPLGRLLAGLAGPGGRLDVLVAGTPFARAVMRELALVGAGTTISYGELAARAGAPRAARAVGTVMARTLVPLVVPCHRVVPAGGGVGAYGPHPRMKRRLLELEGALTADGAPVRGPSSRLERVPA